MRARTAFLALLTAAIALSGCIAGDDPHAHDDAEEAGEPTAPAGSGEHYTLPLSETTWDRTNLLVLVVPPLYGELGDPGQINPYDGVYMRAVEDSIIHWQETITEHGSEEVRQITFDVLVLGRDVALPDVTGGVVDILVVNPLKPPLVAPFSGVGIGLPSGHCVVYNSINPTEDAYDWIFALAGHEFGHCLGMGHPTDHHPWEDLMSYTDIYIPEGETMPPLECVSNMNLRALEETFAPAFGRTAQGPIVFPASEYVIYDCWERFHPDWQ